MSFYFSVLKICVYDRYTKTIFLFLKNIERVTEITAAATPSSADISSGKVKPSQL